MEKAESCTAGLSQSLYEPTGGRSHSDLAALSNEPKLLSLLKAAGTLHVHAIGKT